jgi:hypothetical protein
MADGTRPGKTPDIAPALLEQLAAAMSGLTLGEMEETLQRLLTGRSRRCGAGSNWRRTCFSTRSTK